MFLARADLLTGFLQTFGEDQRVIGNKFEGSYSCILLC